jgi:hypothetical protein
MSELERQAALFRQVQSIYLFGEGAPTVAPQAPRAQYTRLDGALGSIVYVWDGFSWTAVY